MTEKQKTEAWAAAAQFISFIGFMIFTPMVRGFVFCKLWAWYIVVTFGFPFLSIPAGIGISVLLHYGTNNQSTREAIDALEKAKENAKSGEKPKASIWKLFIGSLSASFTTLGIGWLIHLFM